MRAHGFDTQAQASFPYPKFSLREASLSTEVAKKVRLPLSSALPVKKHTLTKRRETLAVLNSLVPNGIG